MTKKNIKKSLLTCFGAVAIAAPLTSVVSCGKQNDVNTRVGSEYDKEYGVNEAVYKKLKTDFTNQVMASLHTQEEKEKARKDLSSSFTQFDKQYNEQNLSYTALTNSMIEFASRVYNIRLQRQTVSKTAKWEDIEVEFQGMQKSFYDYMEKEGFSKEARDRMLADSTEQFRGNKTKGIRGFMEPIKEKYADPLMGLITAKGKLMSCFSAVSKDIALVAASIRIHEFFDNHNILYETDTDDNAPNKFNNMLEAGWLQEDSDFSSHIAKVFVIEDKVTGQTLEEFEPDKICPGFVVRPILKSWIADPRTNNYILKIDWTCISNTYDGTNDAADATAHYYNSSDELLLDQDMDSVHEYLKNIKKDAGLNYNVVLSKAAEIKALKDSYFSQNNNEQHLELDWNPDQKEINAYDAFFFGKRTDDGQDKEHRSYEVGMKSLAQTGVTVSSIKEDTNDITTMRLDELMDTEADGESQVKNINDTLIDDFVKNCDLSAKADIDMSKSDTATVTIYANYKNSPYTFENDEHKVVDTKNPVGFTISTRSYDYLTSKYNENINIVETYSNNIFKEQYEAVKAEVIFESIMFGLSGLFAAQITAFCFVPVFAGHLPLYIVLLVLTWVSMAGQAACLGLVVDKKWNKVKKYNESCESAQHSEKIQNFAKWLKDVSDNNFLKRMDENHFIMGDDYDDGYDKFNKKAPDFLHDVLPEMDTFQRINQDIRCQQFMEIVEGLSCSPTRYGSEMKIWDKHGYCTIASTTLMWSTLAIDIVCIALMAYLPELKDWELVTKARMMAITEGTTFKSFIQTYKILKRVKDFAKYIKLTKGASAAAEFTNATKDLLMSFFHKEGKNIVKYGIITDKFLAECPKAYEFACKNWMRSTSSLANFAKFFAEGEAAGVAGLSGICKSIFRVGLDGAGKAVQGFEKASKEWLRRFLWDLQKMLSSMSTSIPQLIAKSGQGAADALRPILSFFKALKPEAKDTIKQLLTIAADGVATEGAEVAFKALSEIDNMLFKETSQWLRTDTQLYQKLISKDPDILKGALKSMQSVMTAPIQWLSYALDRITISTLENASDTLFLIIRSVA